MPGAFAHLSILMLQESLKQSKTNMADNVKAQLGDLELIELGSVSQIIHI